jgi:hypothetical protein
MKVALNIVSATELFLRKWEFGVDGKIVNGEFV